MSPFESDGHRGGPGSRGIELFHRTHTLKTSIFASASASASPPPFTLLRFSPFGRRTNDTVMPTEVGHVDELIEEYDGREAELIEILNSMRENED